MAEHKTLWLLRHGEVQAPPGVYYGRRDYVLSPRGVEQARRAGERLKQIPLDKVFCPPLRRCLQTARLVRPELPPTAMEELNDLDFGLWEEMPIEKAMEDKDAWENWTQRGEDNAPPGGESLRDFQNRCAEALVRMLDEIRDGGAALAVAPSGCLRSMTAQALGLGSGGAGLLACSPGALSCLEFLDGAPLLSRWNG